MQRIHVSFVLVLLGNSVTGSGDDCNNSGDDTGVKGLRCFYSGFGSGGIYNVHNLRFGFGSFDVTGRGGYEGVLVGVCAIEPCGIGHEALVRAVMFHQNVRKREGSAFADIDRRSGAFPAGGRQVCFDVIGIAVLYSSSLGSRNIRAGRTGTEREVFANTDRTVSADNERPEI